MTRRILLQAYRAAVLVAMAWIIRAHYVRLQIEGDAPITMQEVKAIYPTAASLRPDAGERRGMWVMDAKGQDLGYVLRTMPDVKSIVGYRGWTDTLVAFDPALHVVGVRVRSSQDTREHVGDIRDDRYFLKTWNGKPWDEVASRTPKEEGIEGVSGASMTSVAMADGIMRRLAAADAAMAVRPPSLHFGLRDGGLVVIIGAAIILSFTGSHGRPWLRRSFQILVIAYVGFFTGDLLAQSLVAGWAQSGAPWRLAPALVLLLGAALAIPWTTGKPLYCQQLCPHGALQELLHRIAPKRWRTALRADLAAGLRWLPAGLLAVVIATTILGLPIDLAHLEP
ncbi:MAG TPA: 4Fe-4S binding protein, partial [Chthoniobacteraceae bacterium]